MDKRNYEITYLINPGLNRSELEVFRQKISSLLKNNGEIIREKEPEKTNLVFSIKGKKEAFLAVLEVESEPEKIISIGKELEKEENILRFIIIKREFKKEKKGRRTGRKKDSEEKVRIIEPTHF